MLDKILLANSGTGHTEEMLQYLLEIPALGRAKIALLHVVTPQVGAEAMTEKWEEGGKILARAIQKLRLDPDRITTILRQGEPKDTVCQVAEELQADLIVMGSRGLKRIEAILENSVSQYVFQLASRSMLLVKDDIYVEKIQRVMVAIDKYESTQYCLDLALFFLREIPAGQLLLSYVDPARGRDTTTVTGNAAAAHPAIAPTLARARRLGLETRCFVTGGNAGKAICALAAEQKTDLLLLGSPERRPSIAKTLPDLDRLLGSSVSDYVRVNATCPVLLGRTAATP